MKNIPDNEILSKLYKNDFYTTEDYDYIISKKIIEYDIKDAGFNLSKYYKLLPDDKLNYLKSLHKSQRTIQIGRYMRDDLNYNKELTKSFEHMRGKLKSHRKHIYEYDVIYLNAETKHNDPQR